MGIYVVFHVTIWWLQALRRFENMGSIKINGAAKIADLAMLAVELEEDAGAWRVSSTSCSALCIGCC